VVVEQILEAYPSGKLPPIDKISLRDPKELEPFLKEPFSTLLVQFFYSICAAAESMSRCAFFP
jgi:hypothetical protein